LFQTEPKVYKEDVGTVVKAKSDVDEYEDSAKALREIHAQGVALCDAKKAGPEDCAKLNVLYQETRKAFIAQGDRLKDYIRNGSTENAKAYTEEKTKYKSLKAQLDELAKKLGIKP